MEPLDSDVPRDALATDSTVQANTEGTATNTLISIPQRR
jgi:hypothetical protein